jgi:hypothetical protein
MDASKKKQVIAMAGAERELVQRNAVVDRGRIVEISSPIGRADCRQVCCGTMRITLTSCAFAGQPVECGALRDWFAQLTTFRRRYSPSRVGSRAHPPTTAVGLSMRSWASAIGTAGPETPSSPANAAAFRLKSKFGVTRSPRICCLNPGSTDASRIYQVEDQEDEQSTSTTIARNGGPNSGHVRSSCTRTLARYSRTTPRIRTRRSQIVAGVLSRIRHATRY